MEILRFGSRGTLVEYLQLALIRAGYTLTVDGIFGARTRDAVRDFQQKNGLPADGIVGRQTWAKLMPYLKGYTTHTVRSGDTFFRLAQMYNTDMRRIMLANPTVNPQNLQIGTTLYIPFAFELVPTAVAYSSLLTAWIVEGLTVRYPFLQSSSVGKSVMGRDLLYLRFGQGEKEVFYNAAQIGRASCRERV